jgi:heptosyltransferase II
LKTLIIKLGATGDVVRTTTLLEILPGEIHWLTSDENLIMLSGNQRLKRCVPWTQASLLADTHYDLVINLEDSFDVGQFLSSISYKELFGSYLDKSNKLIYTESSREWFDIGIISRFGKTRADELKYQNRKSYQELIFGALGYAFEDQKYYLPDGIDTELQGDVALANSSGAVWPMKTWAYYGELKKMLEMDGYRVNLLPTRPTLLEHIADVRNHRFLISGDTLPMHIGLGSNMKCITIFQCTSPWEIHDYGLQLKVVSPLLRKYFYARHFDVEATTCIPLAEVYEKVIEFFGNSERQIIERNRSIQ